MTLARNLADLGNQVDSSGTLGIGGGGTSATNATAGFNALAPSQTSNTNKYLTTNGTNTSWADVVSGMTVTSLSYSGDDQAVDPSNPLPCTLTGTNFVEGSIVYVNTISAANSGTSINVTSSTSITFTPPSGLSAASYNVWIVSPTGTIAILANGILYSGAPSWAGQSTSLSSGGSVSIQLTATGDTPMTYSLVSGTLPTGTTLSSSGLISGTATTSATYPNIVVKATDPESQDASVTIEITITLADAYFPYVTMLLHGDGANGSQNNTFVDSSGTETPISRSGSVTQGSFSPYGSNWGNYFDGSSAYLTVGTTSLALGTNNFSLEFWCYQPSYVGEYDNLFTCSYGASAPNYKYMAITNGAYHTFLVGDNSSSWLVNISFTAPPLNQWNHYAVTRSGSSWALFINGTRVGTATYAGSVPTINYTYLMNNPTYGVYAKGYMSNFRIVNGTAIYDPSSSTITVPTTPLTAVSGTSLLTCQSNRFIDNSSNAFAITVNGTPSVQRFSPFAPSSAYSTATVGGSANWTGAGNLTTSANTYTIDANSTMEAWIYPTTYNNYCMLFTGYGDVRNDQLTVASNGVGFVINGNVVISNTGTIVPYAWNHVAATWDGSTYSLYLNGVRIATASNGTAFKFKHLGASDSSDYFTYGYVTNWRYSTSLRYSGTTYTIPTAPFTTDVYTQLLLSCTNSAIYDNAMMNDLETVGNAQISTSVVKYGTGSLAFDGTGDYLLNAYNQSYNFGTGAFTIEGWFYLNSLSRTYYALGGTWSSETSDEWLIQVQDNGSIRFLTTAGTSFYSANITSSTWYHFAVVRNGSTITLYINGTSVGSYANSNSIGSISKPLQIGQQIGGSWGWNGYIDDLRITNGYARYTANFTPPASAFANT